MNLKGQAEIFCCLTLLKFFVLLQHIASFVSDGPWTTNVSSFWVLQARGVGKWNLISFIGISKNQTWVLHCIASIRIQNTRFKSPSSFAPLNMNRRTGVCIPCLSFSLIVSQSFYYLLKSCLKLSDVFKKPSP